MEIWVRQSPIAELSEAGNVDKLGPWRRCTSECHHEPQRRKRELRKDVKRRVAAPEPLDRARSSVRAHPVRQRVKCIYPDVGRKLAGHTIQNEPHELWMCLLELIVVRAEEHGDNLRYPQRIQLKRVFPRGSVPSCYKEAHRLLGPLHVGRGIPRAGVVVAFLAEPRRLPIPFAGPYLSGRRGPR